jgi:hypothetical protein
MSRPSSKPFAAEMNSKPVTIKKPPESARHNAPGTPGVNDDADGKFAHPVVMAVVFKGLLAGIF